MKRISGDYRVLREIRPGTLSYFCLLACAVLLLAPRCQAQAVSPEPEAGHLVAPVMVDGDVLFSVRGISAFPAEQRAREIGRGIAAVAADATISPDALQVIDSEDVSTIKAGDRTLMVVAEADAALESVDRRILAQVLQKRIAAAIIAYRQARSPGVLLRATLYTFGVTGLLVLALFVLNRAFRKFHAVAQRTFYAKMKESSQPLQIVPFDHLWTSLSATLQAGRTLVIGLIIYGYVDLVLGFYPWTLPLALRLFEILVDPLRTIGFGILGSVPSLVFVAVLVVIVRYAIKLMRLFFDAIESQTISFPGFDHDWAIPTFQIARGVAVAFGLVIAYPYLPGSQSEAFKGVSLLLGAMLSLGSSSAIANIIAGYSLTYRRAFKVGDRVRIGEAYGDVAEIRLQVTHLRSVKNEEVIIPNSAILNSNVVNYCSIAKQRGLILHTTVGIGYETPWRQVEAMLLQAAERTPGLLREPRPYVLQKSLGDFAVTYEINVYCDQPNQMGRFYTALHRNILDVFNEYDVQIMTPAYEGDPKQPKVVPKEKWFASPAAPPEASGDGIPDKVVIT